MTKKYNLYGKKKVKIPTPEFIVFYNGREEMPERQVLCLSDLYDVKEEKPALEVETVMLNICGQNNKKLKEACQVLKEYAIYTDLIREYVQDGMTIEEAVETGIEVCIRNGVLKEFLEKNRSEAIKVSIYEYDQKKHMMMEREEGREEGREETILEYVKRGIITKEFASEELKISFEELEKKLEG